MKPGRSTAYGGVSVALLLFVACGAEAPRAASDPAPKVSGSASSQTQSGQSDGQGSGSARSDVKVIDTDFKPVRIVVERGSIVVWQQIGDQPHSVSAADGSFDSSPDCGPLDSDRCLGQGDTFRHTFEEAGTYTYYCRVHGLPDGTGMVGTVVVR